MKTAGKIGSGLFALSIILTGGLSAAYGDEKIDAKVHRLEQLLERQSDQISVLESRLKNAEEGSLSQVQAAEMRKMIKEVMADTDFRSQLVAPTMQVGYDKGFYIRSSDESFGLKIQLGTQFRYLGVNRQTDNPNRFGRQSRDDLNGFEWERSRLIFRGHLFSKELTYKFQIDGDTDGNNDLETIDLYFDWQYAKGHKIRWGQFKVPQGMQTMTSSFEQLVAERSMTSGVFALGRSIGFMAHGEVALNDDTNWQYMVGLFNGFNDPNDDVRDGDTNFSYAVRTALEVGDYGKNQVDDREDKSSPGYLFGLHFAFNDDNGDRSGPPLLFEVPDLIRFGRGGSGIVDASGSQYFQFGGDFGVKCHGFSLAAEYFVRTVEAESRRSPLFLATLDDDSTHVQGGYLQLGYLIPETKLEPVARFGGIWDNDGDNAWEYSVGANYYIKGHALKVSGDVTWMPQSAVTSSSRNVVINDDATIYRLQVQVATK